MLYGYKVCYVHDVLLICYSSLLVLVIPSTVYVLNEIQICNRVALI